MRTFCPGKDLTKLETQFVNSFNGFHLSRFQNVTKSRLNTNALA